MRTEFKQLANCVKIEQCLLEYVLMFLIENFEKKKNHVEDDSTMIGLVFTGTLIYVVQSLQICYKFRFILLYSNIFWGIVKYFIIVFYLLCRRHDVCFSYLFGHLESVLSWEFAENKHGFWCYFGFIYLVVLFSFLFFNESLLLLQGYCTRCSGNGCIWFSDFTTCNADDTYMGFNHVNDSKRWGHHLGWL